MKRVFRSKRFRMLAALTGLLAAAWAAGAAWDTYKVATMTEKMKTVCVGRLLLDLPAEAQVELYGAQISGFHIDAFAESADGFQKRLAAREAEIRATPDRLGGGNNLEAVRDVRSNDKLTGKIFIHGRYVTEGDEADAFTIKHFRYEGIALEAHLHANGLSIDLSAKKYDPERMQNLFRLVAQVVPNPANSIPTDPGFCIDRAYIRDPLSAEQLEQITLAVKLPSYPDIGLNFDTIAGIKPDPGGLLARNEAAKARLLAPLRLRVTELRAAPRTIGGLSGEELVERIIENNLSIVYGFNWEVNGTENNVYVPAVTLTMVTGRGKAEPIGSSLSEPAALALWDRISSSIRIRPVAR